VNSSATLVFFHGALGDGVLLWPLLRTLVPLTLVGRASAVQLAAHEIDGIEAVDDGSAGWTRLFSDDPQPTLATEANVPRELFATHRIVSFVSDGADPWARNVMALRPDCPCWFVSSTPPDDVALHVTEYRRRQLERAGLRLPIDAVASAHSSSRTVRHDGPRSERTGRVVLAPGSGAREKCWAPRTYERLARHLIHRGLDARIVMGHVELERFDAELRHEWEEHFDVRYPPTPLDLADEIRNADVYVGNDSGPTQLAAQLGVDTVALFGPSDPRVWSPVGNVTTVIAPSAPQPMDWLEYETVERIVDDRV